VPSLRSQEKTTRCTKIGAWTVTQAPICGSRIENEPEMLDVGCFGARLGTNDLGAYILHPHTSSVHTGRYGDLKYGCLLSLVCEHLQELHTMKLIRKHHEGIKEEKKVYLLYYCLLV
jgi:hypothetical protein